MLIMGFALLASPAASQTGPRVSVAVDGALAVVRAEAGATREEWNGPILGGEGRVTVGRLSLSVAYREGRLQPDGSNLPSDLIEGRMELQVRLLSQVFVGGGPYARALLTPGGVQRRVMWPVLARLEFPLVASTLATYLEMWRSVAATRNPSPALEGARGGEVGLQWHPGRRPVLVRLSYSIDYAELRGNQRETIEAVRLALGVGRR